MATHENALFPVYVWELPVRIWRWVMAVAMVVLGVTGYLIGTPPPTLAGEASDHFMFGYIRFAHFAAAYVFAVFFVMRVLWIFMGNRFAREIFSVPLAMFGALFLIIKYVPASATTAALLPDQPNANIVWLSQPGPGGGGGGSPRSAARRPVRSPAFQVRS